MRVVITGGSGQIGQILARHFHARGDAVAVVARHNQPAPWSTLEWDGLHRVFLRTESELVLKSRRVVPRRLLEAGFEFHLPDWNVADDDLVRRWKLALSIPSYIREGAGR